MTIGIIAILRGITPGETADIGSALYEAGIRSIEVPLNSPDPLASIHALRGQLPAECLIGAGTVLTVEDVRKVSDAGAQMVVSPNTVAEVISATVDLGLRSYPGAATPSEAFEALHAGADAVKIFPAETIGITGMKAWRAVLPPDTRLVPVGGIDATNLSTWRTAGADGAGIGGTLYRPGDDAPSVRRRASELMHLWEA